LSVPADAATSVAAGTLQTVERRGRRVRRAWRRTGRRLALVTGLAAGYVTGARAGRERYEQILGLASRGAGRG
jgi:hypothetical protein